MTIDEAALVAWLDGELAPAEAERVALAVAADPALKRLADAHRALAARLAKGFAPLATEPVASKIVSLAARRVPRFVMPTWTALAATLVVGVVAGALVAREPASMLSERHGEVLAQGGLATALDTQLASAPQAGQVRIALTFRGHDGRLCRSWSAAEQEGVACRTSGGWAIRSLAAVAGQRGTGYRMAAGSDPQVAAAVDRLIDGEPLDAVQEAEAKRKAWR